jgi:hypothetical protein
MQALLLEGYRNLQMRDKKESMTQPAQKHIFDLSGKVAIVTGASRGSWNDRSRGQGTLEVTSRFLEVEKRF